MYVCVCVSYVEENFSRVDFFSYYVPFADDRASYGISHAGLIILYVHLKFVIASEFLCRV